ncbi:SRP54-type protein, GTPase domain-containing protein [Ditylenchus destructor]|uniref:SRP54-type protein, GTPase domain-containing protein n=1 Tax=Ditylenchus destructor TaxID=166010 RepID=A0AAD4QRH7_9BILA|nr:SRP54-type protein, GTPase domain-containing protein [Ditylenchus destructor]
MMVGLQGSGKTTTTAKIARLLKKQGKKVMMASLDVNRPARAGTAGGARHPDRGRDAPDRRRPAAGRHRPRALQAAKLQGFDVLMLDTAGRLHVDQQLMDEMKAVADISKPQEILLVVDSLTGQDAVNVAQSFSDQVPLTPGSWVTPHGRRCAWRCRALGAGHHRQADQVRRRRRKARRDRAFPSAAPLPAASPAWATWLLGREGRSGDRAGRRRAHGGEAGQGPVRHGRPAWPAGADAPHGWPRRTGRDDARA